MPFAQVSGYRNASAGIAPSDDGAASLDAPLEAASSRVRFGSDVERLAA
jgi:hypothetical protein